MRFEYLVENRILDGENYIYVIQDGRCLFIGVLNYMELSNYLDIKDAYIDRLRGVVFEGNATIEIFLK